MLEEVLVISGSGDCPLTHWAKLILGWVDQVYKCLQIKDVSKFSICLYLVCLHHMMTYGRTWFPWRSAVPERFRPAAFHIWGASCSRLRFRQAWISMICQCCHYYPKLHNCASWPTSSSRPSPFRWKRIWGSFGARNRLSNFTSFLWFGLLLTGSLWPFSTGCVHLFALCKLGNAS